MHFLEDLTDDQQRWYLRYIGGETVAQIAAAEDIPRTTLGDNIARIKSVVRSRFSSRVQEMKEATSESMQWKIRELHRAWNRSKHSTVQYKFKLDVQRTKGSTPTADDSEFGDDADWQNWLCEKTVTEKMPDARYLTEARHCEELLADWWGYGTSDDRNKDDDPNENGMTDEDIVSRDLRQYVDEFGADRVQEMIETNATEGGE